TRVLKIRILFLLLMIISCSCWTHLGCSGCHPNTVFPVILLAAEEPGLSSEPAWKGGRLGELRHWKRPETLGLSECGQHQVTTTGSESCPLDFSSRCHHPVSQSIKVKCLIGAEWMVFHCDCEEICRQTTLLFLPQHLFRKRISCETSFAVAVFYIGADMQ
uniref:Uncharacterized protein n=1 Tax=Strigops habroptila TaxID=2489341 RepID=A0A672U140_STRHB